MNIYGHKVLSYLLWRLVMKQPRLRRVLQRIVYPNKEVSVTLLGTSLTVHTQRELGYWRAARNQSSNIVFRDEVAPLITVSSLIGPESTFVDCGANVGLWTCSIARLKAVFPRLKVLAFEPNPDTFSRLQKSVSAFDNVQTFCTALSDEERDLEMFEGAGSNVFGVKGGSFQIASAPRTLHAVPLDAFLTGIDHIVMKVDVEGHELAVLRGADQALTRGAFNAIYIDGFAAADEQAIVDRLLRGGLTTLLNGRTLRRYQTGDPVLLAVRPPAA